MRTIKHFQLRLWLYLIITLIGTSLKFYKVDFRYFWFDEICSIEHTSGLTGYQTYQLIPKNEIKNITYYKDLLHLNSQNYTIGSQLKGLSRMTNLNPLHYEVLVFWHRIVGDDDVDYRLFNVFLFILTLPFLFLLAKTLFKSDLSGWIAVSLFAVSPFFHYYAHEARYNILLTFLLIVNNYLFLMAINDNKIKWWTGYLIVGILALYASIVAGIVIIGHLIYIMIFKKELRIRYFISVFLILIGYLPWLISVIDNRNEISAALSWHSWYGTNQNFVKLIIAQLTIMARSYVTLNNFWDHMSLLIYNKFDGNYIQICAMVLIIFTILCSVIYAFRKLNHKVSFFLALIILPQFLLFLLSDLFRGTGSSLIYRYHLINILGALLFITFLISRKISLGKLIYSFIYTGLIILGLFSILLISKDRCWDVPLNCENNIEDARLFSSSNRPLLITDCRLPLNIGIGGFMAIMNECTSNSIDIMQTSQDVTRIKEKIPEKYYSEVYLVYATDELVNNMKLQFGEKMDSLEIEGISPIWQINLDENNLSEN